jgi:predicted dehydrogenase
MSESRSALITSAQESLRKPRLGFLGVGWIGQNRMEAVARSGAAEVTMICDSSDEMAARALGTAPDAQRAGSLQEMLNAGLDGVVIATPSALHAEQAIAALERGIAVFCQKPLGRTAAEVAQVVEAARSVDRSLGVDLSYRHTAALRAVREAIHSGDIGDVYAVNLVFHNGYGPDKPWFYDPRLAGGGCLIDLGIHLVDAALWMVDFPDVSHVSCRLFSATGAPMRAPKDEVEHYAVGQFDMASGATVNVACSWKLPAGRDCIIAAEFYGTRGGAAMRNVNGSFYDFVAERYHDTTRTLLVEAPDAWSGRAAVDWAERLARGERFSAEAGQYVAVARVLDLMYGR